MEVTADFRPCIGVGKNDGLPDNRQISVAQHVDSNIRNESLTNRPPFVLLAKMISNIPRPLQRISCRTFRGRMKLMFGFRVNLLELYRIKEQEWRHRKLSDVPGSMVFFVVY